MNFDSFFVELLSYLEESHPAWVILMLCLLPLLPVPVSPLWILAGVKFGVGNGLLISLTGLVVNLTVAYGVAYRLGLPALNFLKERFHLKIPLIPSRDVYEWILLLRITPGIPFFFQNYALGANRVPFFPYLWISFLIQSGYCLAFILLGGTVLSGKKGVVLTGVLAAICVLIVVKLISKYGRRKCVEIEK